MLVQIMVAKMANVKGDVGIVRNNDKYFIMLNIFVIFNYRFLKIKY